MGAVWDFDEEFENLTGIRGFDGLKIEQKIIEKVGS
jgi:hypothetical protein